MLGAAEYNFVISCRLERDLNTTNDTLKVTKTVLDVPTPTIAKGVDTVKTNKSELSISVDQTFVDYDWSVGIDGRKTNLISTNGKYSVTVTDNNGCKGSTSIYVKLNVALGIGIARAEEQGIFVYPNPANEELNLQVPNGLANEDVLIRILSLDGKLVFVKKVHALDSSTQLDIGLLMPGAYQLQLMHDNKFYTTKLMVE
ncbi:MAG: T9SS type A sorting domain-containing protein [Bacteroidales bacterium]|nr:T9SS type A sorting domain-containing protein [Bacteroidales bacterium]